MIAPNEVDTKFLKNFKKTIESKNHQFVIICGGGKTARSEANPMQRKALQAICAVMGIIVMGRFAVPGLIWGAESIGAGDAPGNLADSEVRFFAAILLAVGALFFWMVPRVEQHVTLLRILFAGMFLGGLARLLSISLLGPPPRPALVALVIELAVPPVALLLQRGVLRRAE